jgi:hypothetical protein
MTTRDVRDLLIRNFEGIAERYGVARSKSRACALEMLAAVTGQGISTVRPAAHHDPAADWRKKPAPADPTLGANQVRAALYGTGQCPLCRGFQALTASGTLADHPTTDADGITLDCLGAGLEPFHPQLPKPRTHL